MKQRSGVGEPKVLDLISGLLKVKVREESTSLSSQARRKQRKEEMSTAAEDCRRLSRSSPLRLIVDHSLLPPELHRRHSLPLLAEREGEIAGHDPVAAENSSSPLVAHAGIRRGGNAIKLLRFFHRYTLLASDGERTTAGLHRCLRPHGSEVAVAWRGRRTGKLRHGPLLLPDATLLTTRNNEEGRLGKTAHCRWSHSPELEEEGCSLLTGILRWLVTSERDRGDGSLGSPLELPAAAIRRRRVVTPVVSIALGRWMASRGRKTRDGGENELVRQRETDETNVC
nr:hypothetical protein Iba_chr11dCG11240 [Ipomoea batatas]